MQERRSIFLNLIENEFLTIEFFLNSLICLNNVNITYS